MLAVVGSYSLGGPYEEWTTRHGAPSTETSRSRPHPAPRTPHARTPLFLTAFSIFYPIYHPSPSSLTPPPLMPTPTCRRYHTLSLTFSHTSLELHLPPGDVIDPSTYLKRQRDTMINGGRDGGTSCQLHNVA